MIAVLVLFLAVAGAIPPGVNPWKDAKRPIPKYVLERKSDKGPQDTKEMYRDLAAFPLSSDKLVWPKENPWVKTKGAKEVRAKDFGWDATDATVCLEKALRSPAKVVILDKMPGPWRISSVELGSDLTIVLEKGVEVLGTKASQLANAKEPLFSMKDCRNVFLVGKGGNYVGRYTEKEEAGRNAGRQYGGHGLGLDGVENVAVRNIVFANNGNDGACLSGDRRPSHNVWFEDCVFDRNTRQGVSIVSADGVYFRNCTFSRTCGLAPKCGLDIEPWLPQCNATANIYLIGCVFEGNTGGDLALSTASLWPVTVYAKDCRFKPNPAPSLVIAQRALYPSHHTDAPSDILFENCTFDVWRGATPIRFLDGNFFYITFRGGAVNETEGKKASAPPMTFALTREFRVEKDGSPVERPVREGALVFDNLKLNGFRDVDVLLSVEDKAHLCTVASLHGTVVHNGRKKDMAQFRYAGANAAEVPVSKDRSSHNKKTKRK